MSEPTQDWPGGTEIALVAGEGAELRYRGYAVGELAERATFGEVAYLLLHGRLPNRPELSAFQAVLKSQRVLPAPLRRVLEQLPPATNPMDVLRAGVSALGCLEPEGADRPPLSVAGRLLAGLPAIALYWHSFTTTLLRIDTSGDEETTAGHFLQVLQDRAPDAMRRNALDTVLMLYAEEGLCASTLVARMLAAAGADSYSAITGALGALGPAVRCGEVLALLRSLKTPEEAEAGLLAKLSVPGPVAGFGHPVYRSGDPRGPLAKVWARRLAEGSEEGRCLMAVAERLEAVMARERQMLPHLDFYAALVFDRCGIPSALFAPLVAVARVTGWSAHLMEQRGGGAPLQPAARYTGPEARPVPLPDQR